MKKENRKSHPSDLTDRQWEEDYKFSVSHSESMVIISHLHTLLKRL